jgi:hypothetical protein
MEPVWWRRLARSVLGERIIWLGLPEVGADDFQPIAELTNLQWFYSSNSPINDLGEQLTPLFSLHKLKTLELYGTPITREQVELLREALPDCEIR